MDINFDSFEPATISEINTNPIDMNSGLGTSNTDNNMLNMDMFSGNNNTNNAIDDEEQKRIDDRKKEAQERQEKINKKIQQEENLRQEIRKKASEYLTEFETKRQEDIAKRRENLENNRQESNKAGESNSDSWAKVKDNIDLKDSEYKGSKDVQRMREAMMSRKEDPNSEPLQNFFG